MHVIAFLILLVTAAMLYFLVQVATDIRMIRDDLARDLGAKLADIKEALHRQSFAEGMLRWGWGVQSHHQHAPAGLGCFIVWEWRDGDWQHKGLPQGVQECWPPNYPGAFPGDIARTWAIISGK